MATPAPIITSLNPSNGSSVGGTSVVITGQHFTGVQDVQFGGNSSQNFTINSDTQITALSALNVANNSTLNASVAMAASNNQLYSGAATFTYKVNVTTQPLVVYAGNAQGQTLNSTYSFAGAFLDQSGTLFIFAHLSQTNHPSTQFQLIYTLDGSAPIFSGVFFTTDSAGNGNVAYSLLGVSRLVLNIRSALNSIIPLPWINLLCDFCNYSLCRVCSVP